MCTLFVARIPIKGEECVKILKKKLYREAHTGTKIHKQEMGQRAGKDNTKTGTELRVVRMKGSTGGKCLLQVSLTFL